MTFIAAMLLAWVGICTVFVVYVIIRFTLPYGPLVGAVWAVGSLWGLIEGVSLLIA